MEAIIDGRVPPASVAAFAMALRMKGESIDELAGFASVMRDRAVPIAAPAGALDTCGTGGDGSGTFNISTAVAIVVAGMGATVAKHGGGSASSATGSADVLSSLGVNIHATPAQVECCLSQAGIGFLFAQTFHPGMKHVAAVRRELGVRTVFNLLGPLSNPARAKHQLLGVLHPDLCEKFARVLQRLGSESALIVCGTLGESQHYLDEISISGPTTVARLQNNEIKVVTLDPRKFGIPTADAAELKATGAEHSAQIIRGVLDGKSGPARDIVVLNAAAAAQIVGRAATWAGGLEIAQEAIDSGKAREALQRLIQFSNEK
jgi:anthranilate phosphoribosyltransferase